MGVGELQETIQKSVNPRLTPFCVLDQRSGKAERQKRRNWPRTHGGKVAEAAGEGSVADGVGRVPIEAEVPSGDGEIGGYGHLFAWGQAEQGAIVADRS